MLMMIMMIIIDSFPVQPQWHQNSNLEVLEPAGKGLRCDFSNFPWISRILESVQKCVWISCDSPFFNAASLISPKFCDFCDQAIVFFCYPSKTGSNQVWRTMQSGDLNLEWYGIYDLDHHWQDWTRVRIFSYYHLDHHAYGLPRQWAMPTCQTDQCYTHGFHWFRGSTASHFVYR